MFDIIYGAAGSETGIGLVICPGSDWISVNNWIVKHIWLSIILKPFVISIVVHIIVNEYYFTMLFYLLFFFLCSWHCSLFTSITCIHCGVVAVICCVVDTMSDTVLLMTLLCCWYLLSLMSLLLCGIDVFSYFMLCHWYHVLNAVSLMASKFP